MTAHKAFCKFTVSAAIALLLVGWNVWPIHAEHLNFTLYNESSRSILHLYVSPARSNTWGGDVLGSGILRSGRNTGINFPGQNPNSPCIWDIKVVYGDGWKAVNSFNLCEVKVVNAR